MTTVLIDNGHGADTPGKRSPDGALREWDWTRQVASLTLLMLKEAGASACLLVQEDYDVPLSARAQRANSFPGDKILVSIHANAAQSGACWANARGWEAYVAPGACQRAKLLASLLADEAMAAGLPLRRDRPGVPYKTRSLAILRSTRCPAVLTENLFMDNRDDCRYMLSPDGIQAIAGIHARAILKFLAIQNPQNP